jgi:hypothetical protein
MKFLSGLGAFWSALALSMLVAFSAVAFPETRVGGTKGNDWGSPSYPNWNLPHDCGGYELRGALFGSIGAGDDRIWGNDGCDLIASGKGNDIVYGGKKMDALYGGRGNDKLKGHKGHDHLFGGSGAPKWPQESLPDGQVRQHIRGRQSDRAQGRGESVPPGKLGSFRVQHKRPGQAGIKETGPAFHLPLSEPLGFASKGSLLP